MAFSLLFLLFLSYNSILFPICLTMVLLCSFLRHGVNSFTHGTCLFICSALVILTQWFLTSFLPVTWFYLGPSSGRAAVCGTHRVNCCSRLEWLPLPVPLCRTTASTASRYEPPVTKRQCYVKTMVLFSSKHKSKFLSSQSTLFTHGTEDLCTKGKLN